MRDNFRIKFDLVLKRACLAFTLVGIQANVFCQSLQCLQNVDHPGYEIIIQTTPTETFTREYIMHIPENHNNENPSPLIINLHGFGDCAFDFFETVGMFYEFNELADQENILVAYPQAAYRPLKEDVYWEPGDNGISNIYDNDVYFIKEVISKINMDYNVDLNRVYAIGYSNGGMMAYSLACNNTVSAIGVMSGVMLEEDCDADRAVPIIKFHGIADEVLPYEGSPWYQSVSDIVSFWLDQNNIPTSSLLSTELNEGKVVKEEYAGGDDNSCLQLYTVYEEYDKEGGHVWFSDKIEGSSPNEIIWDFFKENCGAITSTKEEFDTELIVYPNPFYDVLTIENTSSKPRQFKVYNMLGGLEYIGKLEGNRNTIDLGFLPQNIYILELDNQRKKILKILNN